MKKIILSLILLIFIFGCQPKSTQEEKFEINLIKGAGFIYEGKKILEGENFRIGLDLINYYNNEKIGTVCVYDNQNIYYGGIERDCSNFYVSAAQVYNNEKKPGISKLYFPKEGYYSYKNLPQINISIQPEIYIEIQYIQQTQFLGTLNYPSPETESLSFSDGIISLQIEKSIHQLPSNYKILLDIKIDKKKDVNINSDGKNNSLFFSIEAKPLVISCNAKNRKISQAEIINLEKENFIRCEILTNSMNQESIPLIIQLNYKINEIKKIKINVEKM
ncbi:MAG: hypothetical protein QXQ30_00220 [Candidatus Pacearchaeota archaeon]